MLSGKNYFWPKNSWQIYCFIHAIFLRWIFKLKGKRANLFGKYASAIFQVLSILSQIAASHIINTCFAKEGKENTHA